jgi:type IV secretory pathway component VirB8
LFGPLFRALKVRTIIFILGIVISCTGAVLTAFGIYNLVKLSKMKKKVVEVEVDTETQFSKESLLDKGSVTSSYKRKGDDSLSLITQ